MLFTELLKILVGIYYCFPWPCTYQSKVPVASLCWKCR